MRTRIRDMREDRDLTQEYIGEEVLGVGQRTYSRYETGDRPITIECISLLADFYGVSVDYLLFRTNRPEPYEK